MIPLAILYCLQNDFFYPNDEKTRRNGAICSFLPPQWFHLVSECNSGACSGAEKEGEITSGSV